MALDHNYVEYSLTAYRGDYVESAALQLCYGGFICSE